MTEFPSAPCHRIIAHRGWCARHPENSLTAIEAAIGSGARHIEIDVQLSADGCAVLCHDATLERLCGIRQRCDDSSLAQLQQYSFHEPARLGPLHKPTAVTTLTQCLAVIAEHPKITLYIEIKRHSFYRFGRGDVLQAIARSLSQAPAAVRQQCLLISFDLPVLELAHRRFGWQRLAPVLRDWQQWRRPQLQQLVTAKVTELVFCNADIIPDDCQPEKLPRPLAAYEIDDVNHAQALMARGIALIESFDCGSLIRQLQQLSASAAAKSDSADAEPR